MCSLLVRKARCRPGAGRSALRGAAGRRAAALRCGTAARSSPLAVRPRAAALARAQLRRLPRRRRRAIATTTRRPRSRGYSSPLL